MKKVDLRAKLIADPAWDFWEPYEAEDQDHMILMWWGPNTPRDGEPTTQHKVDDRAIEMMNWRQLSARLKRGMDVNHITRVTGYFSFTGGWNPGKQGELKDRAKVAVTRAEDGKFRRADGPASVPAEVERPVLGSAPDAGCAACDCEPADSAGPAGEPCEGGDVGADNT